MVVANKDKLATILAAETEKGKLQNKVLAATRNPLQPIIF